jgi:hypothetical protein
VTSDVFILLVLAVVILASFTGGGLWLQSLRRARKLLQLRERREAQRRAAREISALDEIVRNINETKTIEDLDNIEEGEA